MRVFVNSISWAAQARLVAAAAIACQMPLLSGCDWMQPTEPAKEAREAARTRDQARKLQAACAAPETYDRLKQVVFDEAIRIRNADPVNLDILSANATVRMEEPTVVSRDETLDVTICKGRFILEIPPGAERAFAGERRLAADIEYAAQSAASGSGLVYQIKGAEPIIYKLAAFDLRTRGAVTASADPRVAAEVLPPTPVPADEEQGYDTTESRPEPQPRAEPRYRASPSTPLPPQLEDRSVAERTARSNPSFNCRDARTRSERMVCGSDRLAALDRAMSSRYYSALSTADRPARADLRRTRDRFLAYRERCSSEACVAQAYRDRMDEISDIADR